MGKKILTDKEGKIINTAGQNIIHNFEILTQPLIGLPVTFPWKGHGSTIFVELGKLESSKFGGKQGESSISIDWDWRVENISSVLLGSSTSGPKIKLGIQKLLGCTVKKIWLSEPILELNVEFSNGLFLRSMIMRPSDPEWSIRLPSKQWLSPGKGSLYLDKEGSLLTEEERAVFDLAETTVKRWGAPLQEPKKGNCHNCDYYIGIDGNGDFLDYGVCISENSCFDGQIVNSRSGCPKFMPTSC